MSADDDWPCAYCREPARACGCAASMCCTECGEFWQHCACSHEVELGTVDAPNASPDGYPMITIKVRGAT